MLGTTPLLLLFSDIRFSDHIVDFRLKNVAMSRLPVPRKRIRQASGSDTLVSDHGSDNMSLATGGHGALNPETVALRADNIKLSSLIAALQSQLHDAQQKAADADKKASRLETVRFFVDLFLSSICHDVYV